MKSKVYVEAIRRYILYVQRVNIRATLSEFVKLNINVIVNDSGSNRSIGELQSTWGSRFKRIANESKVSSSTEQAIRRMRVESTCEAFRKETENFAHNVLKRQLESIDFEGQHNKKRIAIEGISTLEEKSDKSREKSYIFSSGSDSNHNSSSDKSEPASNDPTDVIYDNLSLWRSDGPSYVDETSLKQSTLSSKRTKQYIWCLSLSELHMIVTEKVEMSTANTVVKDLYDDAHNTASTGAIKNRDSNTRLYLSGLFISESHQMQPVSVGFVVQKTLSPLMLQNIEILLSTIDDDGLLLLNYSVSNKEELQINHILQDIYFQHSAAQTRNYSEMSLITNCMSCLFGHLWSSKEECSFRDKTSLATFSKSPDNVPTRPDMVFSTKLVCGTELEIANGEIKEPGVSKSEVDKARVRVLETAKRQLHLRLKSTNATHKHITFGVLVYGFLFEFYAVRFIDGFYPYEKISWGQLPRFNCLNPVLEHSLRSILTLKHSMLMSVAGEDTAHAVVTDMHFLPTVTYCEVYKES